MQEVITDVINFSHILTGKTAFLWEDAGRLKFKNQQ